MRRTDRSRWQWHPVRDSVCGFAIYVIPYLFAQMHPKEVTYRNNATNADNYHVFLVWQSVFNAYPFHLPSAFKS